MYAGRQLRFSIWQLMLAVAGAAGLIFLFSRLGALLCSFLLSGLPVTSGWRVLVRGQRWRAACGFTISAIITNGFVAALCVYYLNIWGLVGMAVGSWFGMSTVLGLGASWASEATRCDSHPRRSPLTAWPLVLALAFAPLTMLTTFWPFRVAFLTSYASLNSLADRISAGELIRHPQWVGLFLVVDSDVDATSRNVGLITNPDAGGRCGFVRLGPSVRPEDRNEPLHSSILEVHMSGRWWYREED